MMGESSPGGTGTPVVAVDTTTSFNMDGGEADTNYGGSDPVDGGNA